MEADSRLVAHAEPSKIGTYCIRVTQSMSWAKGWKWWASYKKKIDKAAIIAHWIPQKVGRGESHPRCAVFRKCDSWDKMSSLQIEPEVIQD